MGYTWFRAIALLTLAWAGIATAAPTLTLEARLQGLGPQAGGHYAPSLHSPKSAAFSPDGRLLYVNALEAGETLVFRFPSLEPVAQIKHRFGPDNAALFQGLNTAFDYKLAPEMPLHRPNDFTGKPVEMAFSHQGRFLWIPYYRRSTDPRSAGPSAVAIVDTATQRLVRVIPTGSLPKFVAVSPDSSVVAVIHWGDNTVMTIDSRGTDPKQWRIGQHWSVERRLNLATIGGDRDRNCGYCLRGATFTADGRYLLVARMGGGGIAGFEVASGRYLGTVRNVPATPRHLVLSKDGKTLWFTSNVSGTLSRMSTPDLLGALEEAHGKSVNGPAPQTLTVGGGARTVAVSPDERWAFVASNTSQSIVAVDLHAWKVTGKAGASPFPVGLAVSPDGCSVVSTSQGRAGKGGGNRVDVFRWSGCPKP